MRPATGWMPNLRGRAQQTSLKREPVKPEAAAAAAPGMPRVRACPASWSCRGLHVVRAACAPVALGGASHSLDLNALLLQALDQVCDGVLRVGHRQAVAGHNQHLLGCTGVAQGQGWGGGGGGGEQDGTRGETVG